MIKKIESIILVVILCTMLMSSCGGSNAKNGVEEIAPMDVEITAEFADAVNKALYDEISISSYNEGLAEVKKENKWGYINKKGEVVVPCLYEGVSPFSDGMASVYKNDKYGYINTKGEEVVPCIYYSAKAFSEGLANVQKEEGGKYGYINPKGEEMIPFIYVSAGSFSDNLAPATKVYDGDIEYINSKGEVVLNFNYRSTLAGFNGGSFSDGLALVLDNYKYGYINSKGETVVPCIYDQAESFSDGMAKVGVNGQFGYINTKGEEVIPCTYDQAGNFYDGVALIVNNQYLKGFINKKGECVIPCEYEYNSAWNFSEGLAYVRKGDGKFGYINTDGKEVIPSIYDEAGDFSEGLAPVKKDGIWGFVNRSGQDTFFGPVYEELKSMFLTDSIAQDLVKKANVKEVDVLTKEFGDLLEMEEKIPSLVGDGEYVFIEGCGVSTLLSDGENTDVPEVVVRINRISPFYSKGEAIVNFNYSAIYDGQYEESDLSSNNNTMRMLCRYEDGTWKVDDLIWSIDNKEYRYKQYAQERLEYGLSEIKSGELENRIKEYLSYDPEMNTYLKKVADYKQKFNIK